MFTSVVCAVFLAGAVAHSSIKADLGGEVENPENPVKLWPKSFGGVITCLSITVLVFGCHFNILPMHSELRYQTRANKRIILYTAMALTYLLNMVVSFFGYFQVCKKVKDYCWITNFLLCKGFSKAAGSCLGVGS